MALDAAVAAAAGSCIYPPLASCCFYNASVISLTSSQTLQQSQPPWYCWAWEPELGFLKPQGQWQLPAIPNLQGSSFSSFQHFCDMFHPMVPLCLKYLALFLFVLLDFD
jgi:hypothetical protein